MKNPFKKAALQSGAIKAVCTTAAVAHFIVQGVSDLIVEAESQLVVAIDGNYSKSSVQVARKLLYKADKRGIRIFARNCQLKYVKAVHAVERKVEDVMQGPLPKEDGEIHDAQVMA